MYDPETFALNAANILLGALALLSVAAVAYGVLHDMVMGAKRRAR